MKYIKQYFLWVLLLNSGGLLAMHSDMVEPIIDLEHICDKIDTIHLGLSKYVCFKRFIGTCLSYYKSCGLTQDQAKAEMEKIESYIPFIPISLTKELVLTQLMEKHWYVSYLMHKLVQEKVKEIEAVKGSTIDSLFYPIPTLNNELDDIIYNKAIAQFCKNITGSLKEIAIEDMEFILLPDHTCEVLEVKMSQSGKYLRSTDYENNIFIWDMATGKKMDFTRSQSNAIDWVNDPYSDPDCAIDLHGNYCAKVFNAKNMQGRRCMSASDSVGYLFKDLIKIPMKMWKKQSAILLFKKQQPIEYLCEIAFWNSYEDKDELTALRNSLCSNEIKGFSRDNLNNRFNYYLK